MDEQKSTYKPSYKPLLIITIIITIVWLLSFIVIKVVFKNNYSTMGQFGDLFGSINSLYSGLAFAGLIYTIFLQRNELELQRKELQDTHDEVVRTSNKQALQLKLNSLNAKLLAYSIILNPQSGMKNRTIENVNLHEDEIKKKLIFTLNEIEMLEKEEIK